MSESIFVHICLFSFKFLIFIFLILIVEKFEWCLIFFIAFPCTKIVVARGLGLVLAFWYLPFAPNVSPDFSISGHFL